MLPSLLLGALYLVRGLEIIFKTNNSCHFLTKMLQNAPSCLPAGRQVDGDECSGFKIR